MKVEVTRLKNNQLKDNEAKKSNTSIAQFFQVKESSATTKKMTLIDELFKKLLPTYSAYLTDVPESYEEILTYINNFSHQELLLSNKEAILEIMEIIFSLAAEKKIVINDNILTVLSLLQEKIDESENIELVEKISILKNENYSKEDIEKLYAKAQNDHIESINLLVKLSKKNPHAALKLYALKEKLKEKSIKDKIETNNEELTDLKLKRNTQEIFIKNAQEFPAEYGVVLACMYAAGEDPFIKDASEARYYYGLSAQAGNFLAACEYAKMCIYGEGGEINIDEAQNSLEKFESTSDAYCLWGDIYFYKQDYKNAKKYYFEAALANDDISAYYSLLLVLENDNDDKTTLSDKFDQFVQTLEEDTAINFDARREWFEDNFPDESSYAIESTDKVEERGMDIEPDEKDLPDIEKRKRCLSQLEQDPGNQEAYQKLYHMYKNNEWQLITTLCYESQRHDWDGFPCTIYRSLLGKINTKYQDVSVDTLKDDLKKYEQTSGDYYAEVLSDDSDEEEEKEFNKLNGMTNNPDVRAEEIFKKIEKSTLKFLQDMKQKSEEKQTDEPYDRKAYENKLADFNKFRVFYKKNPAVDDEVSEEVLPTKTKLQLVEGTTKKTIKQDLDIINDKKSKGLLPEGLNEITTKFCVMQFRGITYRTDLWGMEERRNFRKIIKRKKAEGKNYQEPMYAAAVYRKAKMKYTHRPTDYEQFKLKKWGQYMQYCLVKLKHENFNHYKDDPLIKKYCTNKTKKFNSLNEFIQELYTNDYKKFHEFLLAVEETQRLNPNSPWKKWFFNSENFFVSFSDLAYHSIKYAMGNKPYEGQVDKRLRPRWKASGKAERPHSGVVYLTLHPLDDYHEKSNHIPSLNWEAKVNIEYSILQERETSIFSWVEGDRVHLVHLAKYPSFDKPYKNIYLHKYGLTPELYEGFQFLIINSKPHSQIRKLTKTLLGNYLSTFYYRYLTRAGEEIAKKNGYILLYKNNIGTFSLEPPDQVTPAPKGNDNVSERRRHILKKKKRKRDAVLEIPLSQSAEISVESSTSKIQNTPVSDEETTSEVVSEPDSVRPSKRRRIQDKEKISDPESNIDNDNTQQDEGQIFREPVFAGDTDNNTSYSLAKSSSVVGMFKSNSSNKETISFEINSPSTNSLANEDEKNNLKKPSIQLKIKLNKIPAAETTDNDQDRGMKLNT